MASRIIEVFLSVDNDNVHVGTLRSSIRGTKETSSFEYSKDWLQYDGNFALDPELPLVAGTMYAKNATFGAFEDTAPDRWGRKLIVRNEIRLAEQEKRPARTLNNIDYILGVNDFARQGALRFRDSGSDVFLTPSDSDPIPPLVQLPALLKAAHNIDNNRGNAAEFQLLLAPGSSLGGARPKASVIDNGGKLCIAKFPKKDDDQNVVVWEAVALDLATQCGLNVPRWKLESVLNKPVLIIERFDRDGEKRVPFASAMTMLGATDGDGFDYNYTDIADFLTREGANPNEDLPELWRRIVFSVMISNTDDHLRNHGFLRTKAGWVLSPLYDVNPNSHSTDSLHTAISDNNYDATLENALAYKEYFRVEEAYADQTIKHFKTVINNWRKIATKYGLNGPEITRMSSAFKYAE